VSFRFLSAPRVVSEQLVQADDVLEKMVYAYTNPAAADLVDTAEDWPGVSTFEAALTTGRLVATRPKFFFRPDGDLPEVVTIPIVRPRGFASPTQAEWNKLVTDRVRDVEADHRERRRIAGKTVLGRQAILRQKPSDSPNSPEPHFGISPRMAAKRKWPRINAIGSLKAFREKYRVAIRSWMDGLTSVVFPYGTYWMLKFARVACEPAEAAQEAAPVAA